MNETLITPQGLERLQDELEQLKTRARVEIVERLRDAASTEFDLAGNADYVIAREEQGLLEARIARLEKRLAAAEVADADLGNGVVDLGELVSLRNLDTGKRVVYEIVGSLETDLESGRISAASPLGSAVIGRRRGEVVVVDTPRGLLRFKILSIRAPA
jgi:transcription elongation factor GreA